MLEHEREVPIPRPAAGGCPQVPSAGVAVERHRRGARPHRRRRRAARSPPTCPRSDRRAAGRHRSRCGPCARCHDPRRADRRCACSTTRARPRRGCVIDQATARAGLGRSPRRRRSCDLAAGASRSSRCGATRRAPPTRVTELLAGPGRAPPGRARHRRRRRWPGPGCTPGDYSSKLKRAARSRRRRAARRRRARCSPRCSTTMVRQRAGHPRRHRLGVPPRLPGRGAAQPIGARHGQGRGARRRCSTTCGPSSSGSATSPRPRATSTSTCSPTPTSRRRCPRPIQPDLHPLQSFLVEQQRLAHAELVADLDSPRYAALLDRYRAWLADPTREPGADRSRRRPRCRAAGHRVRRRRGSGRPTAASSRTAAASPTTPRRRRCTSCARTPRSCATLLECFGSLFPADEVAPLVKELKGVQDVLGDFQDAEVQKDSLRHFGEALVVERGAGGRGHAAGHGLPDRAARRARAAAPATSSPTASSASTPTTTGASGSGRACSRRPTVDRRTRAPDMTRATMDSR